VGSLAAGAPPFLVLNLLLLALLLLRLLVRQLVVDQVVQGDHRSNNKLMLIFRNMLNELEKWMPRLAIFLNAAF
jgi:hypothetical protein